MIFLRKLKLSRNEVNKLIIYKISHQHYLLDHQMSGSQIVLQ